ncbi:MAG TPA: nuclear transport factor 2 family protein [Candidatus Binataceae bacterium]|nr:nuclear transport factor 2 family protein [Candidatus Binataceae bacterium]
MAKSRDQLIDEMLDREAIRDLPVRYCHYIWTRNVDGIMSLFTDDGIFGMEGLGAPQEVKGREALRKFYGQIATGAGPAPYIHNIVIDLKDATHATGTSYPEVRSTGEQMKLMALGYYADEYEKVGGQWKFKARRFKNMHPGS